jgi:hypothetical protein
LIPDPPPAEVEAPMERRRRWGADTHDADDPAERAVRQELIEIVAV